MKGASRRAAASPSVDLAVSHPGDGCIRLVSRYYFANPKAEICQRFTGRIFEVEEVRALEILASAASAQIEYVNGVVPWRDVVGKISRHLQNGHHDVRAPYVNSPSDLPFALADGPEGWRVERHGPVLSTWEIKHELPGRIRLRNRLIHRHRARCGAVDRALTRVVGIVRHETNPSTATTLIHFDPQKIDRDRLIQILDQTLGEAERPGHSASPARDGSAPGAPARARRRAGMEPTFYAKEREASYRDLAIVALAVGVSAVGAVVSPPLSVLAVSAAIVVERRRFLGAIRSLVRDGKLTVDALMLTTALLSLTHGYFFILCLTILVGMCARDLLDRVKKDSRVDYTDIFRLQAQTVWIRVDGVEVEVPLHDIRVGDVVSVSAGQTIAVDGRIVEGAATVDQHILTGEAAPADKAVGDGVFALTVVLSGKIYVRVEKTGAATAAAHIARVLDNTIDFKTGRQLRAERVADRLVGPAFLTGLLAWPVLGFDAGSALLDTHPKHKATLASSFGLLNYFKLAAREGLLIKDGRILELLNDVDTVVFDKTGTLTLAEPHVRRLYACSRYTANDILRLAAAAEQHQAHPIAKAIMRVAGARGLSIPPITEAEYKVGYGLTLTTEGVLVRVGSMRFIEMEAIAIPPAMIDHQARCHREGHSLVLVAVDGAVAGAVELHTTIRPEAHRIVRGLRQRNVTSTYIISGDHEAPTRRLAEALGVDHYFAETLPDEKAALIERLQEQGKVICYVGDGINDSIAMKRAQVSVSLRGASTLATDTAEVILLDESLDQLCRLFDIARECRINMTICMAAVFVPSVLCVGGVLLGTVTFAHSRVFSIARLLVGIGAGMLPLLTHRKPRPADRLRVSAGPAVDVPIDECVIR